jgi:hypothetical protein
MKLKQMILGTIVIVLALLLIPAWIGSAEESGLDGVYPGPPSAEAPNPGGAAITPVVSYQGRLLEGSAPVSGNRDMTFRLYTAPSAGTLVWQEGPKTIAVSSGLFYTALGDVTPFTAEVLNNLDQNLWLEVTVEDVTLPRQRLMGSPYAFSLAPGADVEGSLASGQSVLKVENSGDGFALYGVGSNGFGVYGSSSASHGVYAYAASDGLDGAALKAQAGSGSGIAAWIYAQSSDTSLVASNDGTGALYKGYGKDGGAAEFTVLNNGTVQQAPTASGLIKAGVNAMCDQAGSTVNHSFNNAGGVTTIANGATPGTCTIDFGFQMDERYFIAQAADPSLRTVTCYVVASGTAISCTRWDPAGNPAGGDIMIVVY